MTDLEPEELEATELHPLRRRLAWRLPSRGVLAYLAFLGPGLISALAGNDAGGIATYSTVGAAYGFAFLWVLVLTLIGLGVVQEMSARLGAITGKGLADLVREEFGIRWTVVVMLTLLVANGGVTIAEFAGIAAAAELLGISKYVAVPLMAVLVWFVVVRGTYQTAERVFLALSATFLVYAVAAFLAHPNWGEVTRSLVVPTFHFDAPFIAIFITVVGTTITPYIPLFAQSAVVDKGVTERDYPLERLDVLFGVLAMHVVAFFIIVATAATLHPAGIPVETAQDAARALAPLAGPYASLLFAIGLFGASMLAASILPLSTSYTICEAFGWERGVSKTFREAPVFNGLYTALIATGALVALIPNLPLIGTMIVSQFVNGLLLPIVLVFLVRLVNDRELMGKHVNGPVYNLITWAMVAVLVGLSATLLGMTAWSVVVG